MKIEIFYDTSSKGIYSFPNHKVIIIGRQAGSDILLEGDDISRDHLHITYKAGKVYLTEQGSTCGVFVNEERLPAFKEIEFTTYFQAKIGSDFYVSLLSHDDENEPIPGEAIKQRTLTDHTKSYQAYKSKAPVKKPDGKATTKVTAKPTMKAAVKKSQIKPNNKTNIPLLLIILALAGAAYYFVYFKPS